MSIDFTYHKDLLTVYEASVRRLIAVMDEQLGDSQSVSLFLSGGSSVRLYAHLADWIKEHPTGSFQGKLAVGQVDERFFWGKRLEGVESVGGLERIEERNKNINAVAIGEAGLWDVCREKGIACHLISQVGTLEESSSEYNQTISSLWKSASKKIAVLGIGEDGHTAGLLPGYQSAWDVDRFVVGYKNDGPFPERISLTPRTLQSLDYAIVVALGEMKRPVLELVSSGKETDLNRFPAGIFRDMNNVEVITDQSSFA